MTCPRGHVVQLEEALSKPPILQAVPCPMCLKRGRWPPYTFNRAKCLLHFSEEALEGGRAGAVPCLYCNENIRVLDIVVPEVFLSYNWGVRDEAAGTYSTQEIVRSMRFAIEDGADVVTWFDVGGGMGAGQSVGAEMQQGVAKSTVVIIFLSDAYCSSGNCVREFLHAVKNSKFIIPVLVPNKGRTASGAASGWTGPGADDAQWWQHANSCSDCKDPDTGASFEWSALGKPAFGGPVDLRVADGNAADLAEAPLDVIVRRIQSRFHRGAHIQH